MTTENTTTAETLNGLESKLSGWLAKALASKPDLDKLAAHYRIAGLYHYSLLNSLLIMLQGGTVCNSYKRWQTIGRQVKKGEKARIQIIRPAGHVSKDDDTGEERFQFDGRFYPAKVFDYTQTDGEPLEFGHNSAPVALDYPTIRAKIEKALSVPVTEEPTTQGRGHTDGNSITISALSNDADKIKTLLHEAAHVIMHKDEIKEGDRARQEVEAEATAYLVMSALGIDYELASDYVAAWAETNHKADVKKIVRAAQKIIEAAKP